MIIHVAEASIFPVFARRLDDARTIERPTRSSGGVRQPDGRRWLTDDRRASGEVDARPTRARANEAEESRACEGERRRRTEAMAEEATPTRNTARGSLGRLIGRKRRAEKTFEVGCAGDERRRRGGFFGNFPYPYMNGLLHLGHAFRCPSWSLRPLSQVEGR